MCQEDIQKRPDNKDGKSYFPLFKTTEWTVVSTASNDQSSVEALSQLCNHYYSALRAYLLRCGYTRDETEELLQCFFNYFLDKKVYQVASPERGRFRCFILSVLKHFIVHEYKWQQAYKRGGGQEQVVLDEVLGMRNVPKECIDHLSPDVVFDKKWAWATIQIALDELRQECESSGRGMLFESLKHRLMDNRDALSYATLAITLGKTEKAIRNDASRFRQRFHQLLYQTVKRTLLPDVSVKEEMEHLMNILRSQGG